MVSDVFNLHPYNVETECCGIPSFLDLDVERLCDTHVTAKCAPPDQVGMDGLANFDVKCGLNRVLTGWRAVSSSDAAHCEVRRCELTVCV